MGSSITVLVPDSSLGAGEALSILCLSEPSENPSGWWVRDYGRGRSRRNVLIES